MTLLGTAFGLVSIWISGFGVLALAGLLEGRMRDITLSYAAGVLVLAVPGSLLLIAGVTLRPLLVYVLLFAPPVLAMAFRRPGPLRFERIRGRMEASALALTVVVLIVIATAALRDRLTWDGWAFWTLRATMLLESGTLPADLFALPGPFDYAHPSYPLALPLLDWWLFHNAGGFSAAVASFAGAVWLVLTVLLFGDSARKVGRPVLAAVGTLTVAAFWPIGLFATGGQADVIIALSLLGVTVHLTEAVRAQEDAAPMWRAAVFAALAAFSKNEGMVVALALLLVGSGWLVVRGRARLGRLAPLALPLLLISPWVVFVRSLGLGAAQLGSLETLHLLPERLVVVARHLVGLAVHRSWIPVPWIAGIGVVLALRRRRELVVPWILLALYLTVALGVYLTTRLDLDWLLVTSLERVMTGVVPAAAFLAIAGVGTRSRNEARWLVR